jgi:hypothetical protein
VAIVQPDLKVGGIVDVYEANYALYWKYMFDDLDNRIKSWDELDKLRELPEF